MQVYKNLPIKMAPLKVGVVRLITCLYVSVLRNDSVEIYTV
jgi:hypothetical protein